MEAFTNLFIYSTNINLVSTTFQGAYSLVAEIISHTYKIKPLNKYGVWGRLDEKNGLVYIQEVSDLGRGKKVTSSITLKVSLSSQRPCLFYLHCPLFSDTRSQLIDPILALFARFIYSILKK